MRFPILFLLPAPNAVASASPSRSLLQPSNALAKQSHSSQANLGLAWRSGGSGVR